MGAASPLLPGEAHYTGLSGQYIVVRHSSSRTHASGSEMSDSRDARARSFCEYIGFVRRFHTHTDLHRKDVRSSPTKPTGPRHDRCSRHLTCWKVENWHPDARRAPRAITPADPCLQRATQSSPSSVRTDNGSPVCGANGSICTASRHRTP